jgi:hypothetical protein
MIVLQRLENVCIKETKCEYIVVKLGNQQLSLTGIKLLDLTMLKRLHDGCVSRRNQRLLIEIPSPVKKATECRQQREFIRGSSDNASIKDTIGSDSCKTERFSDYLGMESVNNFWMYLANHDFLMNLIPQRILASYNPRLTYNLKIKETYLKSKFDCNSMSYSTRKLRSHVRYARADRKFNI